jgi:hypothetical protein
LGELIRYNAQYKRKIQKGASMKREKPRKLQVMEKKSKIHPKVEKEDK